jgi:hypothetical protein
MVAKPSAAAPVTAMPFRKVRSRSRHNSTHAQPMNTEAEYRLVTGGRSVR